VVHVAGTNGKGSVIAFLRAMLEARGLRVHVYTSPHLVRFSERIVVAGEEIADDALVGLLEECEAANGNEPITFFEITTAAALLAFARARADVTLLETGLGGRLDATNVIDDPLLTALTPISMDHQAFLGDTLDQIAGEKAGILKPGVPCVVAAQRPGAARVIQNRAGAVGAPLAWEGTDWSVRLDGEGFFFDDNLGGTAYPAPSLRGAHQIANAGLAVACVRRLRGLDMDDAAIGAGLQRASWPARLQHLTGGRLARLLPEDWELWLDGGHNPAAGEALAAHARSWADKPLYLVFGGLRNKDAEGILAPLAPHARRLVTVAIPGQESSLTAAEAATAGASAGLAGEPVDGVEHALTTLAGDARGPARVLICGSLYLAGSVLAANGP
jgi:dihydrofolate synthase/folylpolyglutamate synthase